MKRGAGGTDVALRTGHLLRIDSYLDWAILSMWMRAERTAVVMGMAEASARGSSPQGPEGGDEKVLGRLRDLIGEARHYYGENNFPAAMARMRTAHDLLSLYMIQLAEGEDSGNPGAG